MTRRLFFSALTGATALLASARRMAATAPSRRIVWTIHSFPTLLEKGDRLSVRFDATPSELSWMVPVATLEIHRRNAARALRLAHYVSAPTETIYIAPEACEITDVQVFYGKPARPAYRPWPVFMKTSTGGRG